MKLASYIVSINFFTQDSGFNHVIYNFSARRFLFIFASDFVSASISILIIMCEKRFTTDKERLKLARKMDINNLTHDVVEKRKSIYVKQAQQQPDVADSE